MRRAIALAIPAIAGMLCRANPALSEDGSPRPSSYYSRLGDTHLKAKNYSEAEAAYRKALEQSEAKEERGGIYERLAQSRKEQGDAGGHIENLKAALGEHGPGTNRYSHVFCRCLDALIEAEKAEGQAGEPSENPKEKKGAKGSTLAEKTAREGMGKVPDLGNRMMIWSRVCHIHREAGTLDALALECDVSKDRKPALEKLLRMKAVCSAKGDRAGETGILERIVNEHPDYSPARKELAESVFEGEGAATGEASDILEKLAASSPEDRNLYAEMLAGKYLKEGKDAEAFRWIIFLKRTSSEMSLRIARLFERSGKTDAALDECRRAAENANSAGEACRARLEMARIHAKAGKASEALKECKEVLALAGAPDWAAREAKGLLGNLEERAKETAEAKKAVTNAKEKKERQR